MSRSLGPSLPADLFAVLDGRDLEAGVGRTILLLTTDEQGWTSVALLSVGEVVAPDPASVRLALWPGTSSTANLTRNGRAVLALIEEGRSDYVRIEARRGEDLPAGGMDHAYFEARVADVLRDEVTYARMTSGISFELPDPPRVLARWRATVEAMLGRAAAGTDGGG